MTTLIPESWELPSYTAGDVRDMRDYRRGTPSPETRSRWERWFGKKTGPNAQVLPFAKPSEKIQQLFEPTMSNMEDWQGSPFANLEPYDPHKHGPNESAELYSQSSLDALEAAGFTPHETGIWHRPVATAESSNEATHIITYHPGYKNEHGGRAPWHLTTDPDTVGVAFSTLHGPWGALAAADEDAEQIRKIPKRAGLYLVALTKVAAGQSAGRRDADDWLAQNTDESFEADPREEARQWMDQHAHEYEEWHPDPSDYTYRDFGDAAGQSFHGDEAQSHVLPGSYYHPEADWETGLRHEPQRDHQQDEDESEDRDEPDEDEFLASHGFNWQADDSTAGTSGNPLTPDTPGHYVKYQIDLDDRHIATHIIRNVPETASIGRWHVESLDPSTSNFAYSSSQHHFLHDAMDKYKRNSAEAMLPNYGYEPVPTRSGETHRWTRTDETPHGTYQHEIMFPEHGFFGRTVNHRMAQPLFAPNGSTVHNSDDLTDVVREHNRLSQGVHPGGPKDHRFTEEELKADPSVSRLGKPEVTTTPWGDGKITRMEWNLPTPEHPRGARATADYNWDTGNYDFKYHHRDGSWLAPTHNYVPGGAPVTIPGRQPQLPLGNAR